VSSADCSIYTWRLKRGISSGISNSDIDDMYALALKNGAVGGKLLGAGGGGFLLFYCEKGLQPRLREALKDFMCIPFEFENRGTQVIYYDAEDYIYETAGFIAPDRTLPQIPDVVLDSEQYRKCCTTDYQLL
jgi:hypothetical protein